MVVLHRYKIDAHDNWTKVENEIEKMDIEGTFISFCDLYFLELSTPITTSWYGILHNPIGWEKYSPWDSNKTPIVDKQIFIDSLKYCKVLFVMAKSQVDPVHKLLAAKGYSTIKIISLYHPVNKLDYSFNYESYNANSTKTIYNIGNWLRKQYTIFKLPCDSKFKKAILPFNPRTAKELMFYLKLDNQVITKEENASVIKCKRLNDKEYHQIFESNLIFLDVYLTTINNTFLEAFISNTPIILSRQQEFVDILGPEYPLFFDSLDQVKDLIKNDETILQAHEYLKRVDKSQFTMESFIHSIETGIKEHLRTNE